MIDSADISVVIQGSILHATHHWAPHGITQAVIEQVRRVLPASTIIVSTWQNEQIEHLRNVDHFVQSKDPQGYDFYTQEAVVDNRINNCNRLITSTAAGLAQVNTPYVLKIRSDLFVQDAQFLKWFGYYADSDPSYCVVKEKILGFSIYSLKFEIKNHIVQYRPYHVSDWAYFGYTEDLSALYACPLTPEPQTSRWFEHHTKPAIDIWPERLWRYSPEQYITSQFAQRYLNLLLAHGCVSDLETRHQSERFIANNFVILDQSQWQLISLKYFLQQNDLPDLIKKGLYTHQVWYEDYLQYCQEKIYLSELSKQGIAIPE
jgi:hypothetical protein